MTVELVRGKMEMKDEKGVRMAIKPVVRYMLLCDDWRLDAANNRRVIIDGLISNVYSFGDPPFPLLYKEMCVFLALADGHGRGEGKIVVVMEPSGQKIFETRPGTIVFGADPLEIVGVSFRIRNILFAEAGLYSAQFWFEGDLVEERPFRLR